MRKRLLPDTEMLPRECAQPLAAAVASAQAAAQASGVEVRDLTTLEELKRVCALYGEIWGFTPGNQPVTTEFLRALAHSGNYVAGAFSGDDLVGACVGFFASPTEQTMHSHVAGVSSRLRGRRVGFALKLHQRSWALARGVVSITWTFDPLVCRNAYFNLAKLAARPAEYLPDFYGVMGDGINGDDESDRLLITWPLSADTVAAACRGVPRDADASGLRAAGAGIALDVGHGGLPVVGVPDADVVLIRIPPDIESLRRADPDAARRWRQALRQVLGGLMIEGRRVTGFDRSGWYVAETLDHPRARGAP